MKPAVSTQNDGPRWNHDCGRCIFLGQYGSHDLYFCRQGTPNSVIHTVCARDGNGAPEYSSGLAVARVLEREQPEAPLAEALRRARASKLV